MRSRIRTLEELTRIFRLSADEHDAVARHTGSLPVGITPYYASLMDRKDPSEPLRRTTSPPAASTSAPPARTTTPWPRTTTPSCPASSTAIPTASCS